MNFEKMLKEVIAASRSRSTKGDASKALAEQGFFDNGTVPESLKQRGSPESTGNPIDVKSDFFRQNPN